MSFILDALRKSEHERQRSALPTLSHVPLAAPRRALPGWALAVMGVLAAAVLVLGGAWWQFLRSPASPSTNAAPTVPSATVDSQTNVDAATTVVVPGVRATTGPIDNASTSQSTAEAATPLGQKRESLASAAAAGLATPRPAPSGPTLPSVTALIAQGINVPTLRLELHAYSDSPSERFVFINGRRYREGERLAEGPQLLTIEPNGVVLSQQGQRFMLAPE